MSKRSHRRPRVQICHQLSLVCGCGEWFERCENGGGNMYQLECWKSQRTQTKRTLTIEETLISHGEKYSHRKCSGLVRLAPLWHHWEPRFFPLSSLWSSACWPWPLTNQGGFPCRQHSLRWGKRHHISSCESLSIRRKSFLVAPPTDFFLFPLAKVGFDALLKWITDRGMSLPWLALVNPDLPLCHV